MSPKRRDGCRQHTRQQSSEVLGPQAAEIFKLQNSTCEFWARCVNMYLERTTDRMKKSVSGSGCGRGGPLCFARSSPRPNFSLSNRPEMAIGYL